MRDEPLGGLVTILVQKSCYDGKLVQCPPPAQGTIGEAFKQQRHNLVGNADRACMQAHDCFESGVLIHHRLGATTLIVGGPKFAAYELKHFQEIKPGLPAVITSLSEIVIMFAMLSQIFIEPALHQL